jgi:hypothetical protein
MSQLVDSLVDRLRRQTRTQREAAGKELYEILTRAKPKEGDDQRLQACAGVLGIRIDALPDVLRDAQELHQNACILATEEGLRDLQHKAADDRARLDEWHEGEQRRLRAEYESRLQPIEQESGRAAAGLHRVSEARRVSINLQARWKALVDGVTGDVAREELIRAQRGA